MKPSAMHTKMYWVVLGLLLLQGLWGTMGEGIGLGLSHARAEQNMMMEMEHRNHLDHHHASAPQAGQWEGSPEGSAYSEFNHALAGVGVILVGLSELRTACLAGVGMVSLALAGFTGWIRNFPLDLERSFGVVHRLVDVSRNVIGQRS